MVLLIGGAYQGKDVFAMEQLGARDKVFAKESSMEELGRAQLILEFQEYIREQLTEERTLFDLINQIEELLLANPGQLIATERFMEKIWGYDSDAEINVVWVYLSGLRKKLARLNANVKIKASRNQGYSLEKIPD